MERRVQVIGRPASEAPPSDSGEALWGFEDVAAYLKVPEDTLRRWRYYGSGPKSVRIGRHVRYDPADVRAWWAEQKRSASPHDGRVRGGW